MTGGRIVSERKSELAQIHIAKAAIGLSDDEYRDLLYGLERVRSAADLSWKGRAHVLDHFRKLGWTGGGGRSTDPVIRKIRSLWLSLRDAGALRDPSERALRAFVKRTAGVDRLEWADANARAAVIEALKDWLWRVKKEANNGR